jgi:hypothetical protein
MLHQADPDDAKREKRRRVARYLQGKIVKCGPASVLPIQQGDIFPKNFLPFKFASNFLRYHNL